MKRSSSDWGEREWAFIYRTFLLAWRSADCDGFGMIGFVVWCCCVGVATCDLRWAWNGMDNAYLTYLWKIDVRDCG
jgi:hypothetical protein